jgi:hypothetical protein
MTENRSFTFYYGPTPDDPANLIGMAEDNRDWATRRLLSNTWRIRLARKLIDLLVPRAKEMQGFR